jgi:quercetin dioxygenase-like cupin family protein
MHGLEVQEHHFIGGVYCKEVTIKDDCEIMQHKHEYDHMSVLVSGCAVVDCEGDIQTYYAPEIIKIKAGKNHSVTAVNGDVKWLCIHQTDETDATKVDDVLIQKKTESTHNMIDTGLIIDVSKLNTKLSANPQLWNQHTLRTENTDSPHYQCDDIWVRFNAIENFDPNNPQAFHGEHESIWYGGRNGLYSQVQMMAGELGRLLGKFNSASDALNSLGGILITRIPPGGKVLRHNDAGRWHAEYYKDKYLIPLKCDDKQAFCFDDERHVTEVGKIYRFNNLVDHWVENNSDQERISLIICMRHD